MMSENIYLDYAAATPVDEAVFAAMQPYFTIEFGNPSAIHSAGRAAHAALEAARESVARSIGARSSEIIFTAGGTESINLAVEGVMAAGGEVIISAIEHDAVRQAAAKHETSICPVDSNGIINVQKLQQLITSKTRLISVIHASNEIGTIQPIRDIRALIDTENGKRREAGNDSPLLLHIDASQSPNYLDVHVGRLGVDLMTLNGGKIYGPKQSGILYVKAGVVLAPQIVGGGQEHGLRSGTENVAFAVGFAKALEIASAMRKDEARRVDELKTFFIRELEEQFGGRINGHKTQRLASNVSVTFPGSDNERVLFALDERGVMAAAGSACSASSDEPSHVLRAIGLSTEDAQSTIRFSLGRATTEEQLKMTLQHLRDALLA